MNSNNVLIVGLGGLGVPAAVAAVRAGVRRLTLIDPDPVELSNLARQVIFTTDDIGIAKVDAAARYLKMIAPDAEVATIIGRLDTFNAAGIIASAAFVIDATDDPASKFLINDRCVASAVPFVYGGVLGYAGNVMSVIPGRSACLRCLFENPPDAADTVSCREAGIIGPVAGVIGHIQGSEAARWIAGKPLEIASAIVTYDAAHTLRMRRVEVRPRAGCSCGAIGLDWNSKTAGATAMASDTRG
jgi:molybdopterin/thiamine biosynthesis adenylyltransferase